MSLDAPFRLRLRRDTWLGMGSLGRSRAAVYRSKLYKGAALRQSREEGLLRRLPLLVRGDAVLDLAR
jgi:hypothetical protein